jgi:Family of unknown function (DUF6510)
MEPVDGNAIAGPLFEVFGLEMTTAVGVCASCSARGQLAELEVYLGGPGIVARCRRCTSVLIVLVAIRGVSCVDLRGLERLDVGAGTS